MDFFGKDLKLLISSFEMYESIEQNFSIFQEPSFNILQAFVNSNHNKEIWLSFSDLEVSVNNLRDDFFAQIRKFAIKFFSPLFTHMVSGFLTFTVVFRDYSIYFLDQFYRVSGPFSRGAHPKSD